MSHLTNVRRRRTDRGAIERQVIQQQTQFGYRGARMRSLRDLDRFSAHPRTSGHPTTTKKKKKRKRASVDRRPVPTKRPRKPRKNAPKAAPGYIWMLSELREEAHLRRVDDTLEKLRERQERRRHLVRNTRPLVPHNARSHYVWRSPQYRACIAHHYMSRPSPLRVASTSLWSRLAAGLDTLPRYIAPTSSQAAASAPAKTASRRTDIRQAEAEREGAEANEVNVPTHIDAARRDMRRLGPVNERLAMTAIQTNVQRSWLCDEIRAIDLIPPEMWPHLSADVRMFLESRPKTPLWPHQVDALEFMLHGESHMRFGSLGGMICDEMGLGKTRLMPEIVYRTRQLQLLRDPSQRHRRPTLMIVPNSISYHPTRELARAYPPNLLRVIRLFGGENQNASAADIEEHVDLIITTYPTISRAHDACSRKDAGRSGYEVLFDLTYERIIVDEGHVFANPQTNVNHAAMALSTRATHAWFFTGTPIQNRFSDIDAALRFIRIDETHIPRAPVVRVHAQNLLEIQRRLKEMERGLCSEADRAEFSDLWHVLSGHALRMSRTSTGSDHDDDLDLDMENDISRSHSHPFVPFADSSDPEEEEDYGGDEEEAEENEEDESPENMYMAEYTPVHEKKKKKNMQNARERKRRKKKKKKKKSHSMVHITQRGVRHFLELYSCRRVMQAGQQGQGNKSVDVLVERTITEVYHSLEATGGRELATYTAKLEELLRTCMLRRTRASVGSKFGRQIEPHERVTIALPRGKSIQVTADAEGFLGPRYLRTHALFSRESDPFSEQLSFYDRGAAESLLYGFYDTQRIDLTLNPHAPNIFEYDVTAQGPFDPAHYELAQAAKGRTEITAAYLSRRGEAANALDREICHIYERHFSVQKRARPRVRAKSEMRTLVAQRGLMAICNQLGTNKRIFLPPFLDPPDPTTSPAALFTQRTEYQRLTHITPSALEYCQATARELKLDGIGDGDEDALWSGRRRLRLPAQSAQFGEVRRMLVGLRPGEKIIIPFNSVETLLQLYFYVREWFPLDDEATPHVQPLVLVGDMDVNDRRIAMERFETDPDYNVLLASLPVISLGHNLDMANLVLAPDANYNPQNLRQATFRAARPGQRRRILLRVPIPRGTMIEHALLIGHEKMSMEEATIGGERASSRSTARSQRGASRISNYIDAWRAQELDRLTRIVN